MKFLLLAASAVTFALTCQADPERSSFEPVGPLHSFKFDAPDGYYQEWNAQITCPVNALRATVQLSRYGKPTTEFEPGVNAYLYRGDEPNVEFAKLGFHATGFHPPFQITMSAGGPGTKAQKMTFSGMTGGASWFSFELRWADNGVIQGNVDGQHGSVKMPRGPKRIHILGFSGAGEVMIQLGYFHTKDPKKDPCEPIA